MNHKSRLRRFVRDVVNHTPFIKMLILLVVLWLVFATAMYFSERYIEESTIKTLGDALYWGIAAFSTAGIADTPASNFSKLIGGVWIIIGSVLFFGTLVATVTSYFMRPLQRPARRIIDTVEYNLEQLDDLSLEELDLLKETIDGLIEHMESIKEKRYPDQPSNNESNMSDRE
ncbi:MAG: potassium channel family protein [Gammaproteobacteria bacterium]|jgi:voltage-gated potassium channel